MSFADDVENFVNQFRNALDATMRETVIEAHNSIKAHTPVALEDGGELRGSWEVSDSDPKWGSMVYISTNKSYAPVIEYGLYPDPVKRGTWIRKEHRYEKFSQGGFSKQAPQGMVRITAKEMKAVAEAIWSQHAP